MKVNYITVAQPIGTFLMCSMNSRVLIDCCFINRRDYDPQLFLSIGGVQRKDSRERVKQIEKYCHDPDATFPTAIIITVDSDIVKINNSNIEFNENEKNLFEIIDGQHRILGINESTLAADIEIPVVIMPDLTEEEKAYVFSTINSNQKRIDPSLIYDLFEVSKHRSPFKTMHEIARAFNSDPESPFYRRLKMLGRKKLNTETISQGTFVNYLVQLISKDPKNDIINIKNNNALEDDEKLPLRHYFINEKDEIIYKVILNYFSAVRDVFTSQWEEPKKYILNRSTGFGGLSMALEKILLYAIKDKNMGVDYFHSIMNSYKEFLNNSKKELTSKHYPSNISVQRKLRDEILNCVNE